jgi:hypothetical protein
MLSPTAKTKRLLEMIQIGLTFASVCTVVDASLMQTRTEGAAGWYAASAPRQGNARGSRLFSDLARTERKRRESELREALQQR